MRPLKENKMTQNLTHPLDELETEVLETLDNPYRAYSVQLPSSVSFTIPDDGHHTKITIESRSEILRYGRDEQDIYLQMELDQTHGRPTYAKHLIRWVSDRLGNINPREATVTYGDDHTISLMMVFPP